MATDAHFEVMSRAEQSRIDCSTPSSARRRKRGQSHSAVEGSVLRESRRVDVDVNADVDVNVDGEEAWRTSSCADTRQFRSQWVYVDSRSYALPRIRERWLVATYRGGLRDIYRAELCASRRHEMSRVRVGRLWVMAIKNA